MRNEKVYKNVEAKANELLDKIPVTGIFKEMILEWLWPSTFRMIRWKILHAAPINNSFLQYFYWTAQGIIDSKRTGESLVHNRQIPVTERFMLACSLCLRNEIHEIWEEMSIDSKRDLVEDESYIAFFGRFWASKLEGRWGDFSTMFLPTILHAVGVGSLETVKHIFSLLPEHKPIFAEFCLNELVKNMQYSPFYTDSRETAYFILLQMNEQSLKTFLKSQTIISMSILLTTEENECIDLLKDKLDTISKTDISNLFDHILRKLYLDIFRDHNYVQLFVSVWQSLKDPCKIWLRGSYVFNYYFCIIISDYFRFLITKKPSKKNIIRLNRDKWNILLFFIENRIVTTASLKSDRPRLFKLLRVRKKLNNFAWRRLFKFVRDKKD